MIHSTKNMQTNSTITTNKFTNFIVNGILLLLCSNLTIHAQVDSVSTNQQAAELKILTWNTYMLPLLLNKGQKKRVDFVIEQLQNSDYDILVLQEMFAKKICKKVEAALQTTFPHQIGPANKKGNWNSFAHSGLYIFSKIPLTHLGEIKYNTCSGADCWSRKGALLVEAQKGNTIFQLVNTHLQANYVGKDYNIVRYSQYLQLKQDLLTPFTKSNVPQIICGDLNTQKYVDVTADTLEFNYHYQQMLWLLDMQDGDVGKGKYTYVTDDFVTKKNKDKDAQLLDYVLYKSNGKQANIQRRVQSFQADWTKDKRDLSDHYAVEAIIEYND